MATLVINVPDEQAEELRAELDQLPGVQTTIWTGDSHLHRMLTDWTNGCSIMSAANPMNAPVTKRVFVDEITLVSEASLAEAWLSPEDDHWDDYYQELCTKKAM